MTPKKTASPKVKPATKAKAKPKPALRFFQLTIPGSGSILHVAEDILINRIVERLTGGAK
ncbi:MAG: hypothetical protein EBY29_10100 [Planctomycetes bacterium]|nr:hypothetical protein [Planctomycetota bacterium]